MKIIIKIYYKICFNNNYKYNKIYKNYTQIQIFNKIKLKINNNSK